MRAGASACTGRRYALLQELQDRDHERALRKEQSEDAPRQAVYLAGKLDAEFLQIGFRSEFVEIHTTVDGGGMSML